MFYIYTEYVPAITYYSLTSAVLQHGLHGTLPVCIPADTSRSGALAFLRPPSLPQVNLVEVIHQEQSCRRERERGVTLSMTLCSLFDI